MDNPDFLRTILADPADDAPRLVYADWLDEHAGPVNCEVCSSTGLNRLASGELDAAWYCPVCDGASNGYAERAAFIRWGVAHPEDSAVCLCLNGRRQPCKTCLVMEDVVTDISRRSDGETHYVVNRGFVAEVRLSTAAFVGDPCPRCPGGRPGGCELCGSSGRVNGIAARLFAAHPIELVTLVDRVPYAVRQGMKPIWVDVRHAVRFGQDNPMDVPSVLFALMTEQPGAHDAHGRRPFGFWVDLEYESTGEAVDALSRACVIYGRQLAGLPSLPTSSESPAAAT